MKKKLLIGLILTLTSCLPSIAQVAHLAEEKDLLRFLHDDNWRLSQICLDGQCEEVADNESFPHGIDTEKVKLNYCTEEEGDFYTLGKYYWRFDLDTEKQIQSVNSCPEYFKIASFCCDGKEITIKLCTSGGYYAGELKIIDERTFQITSKRLEYENREVVQVYKR